MPPSKESPFQPDSESFRQTLAAGRSMIEQDLGWLRSLFGRILREKGDHACARLLDSDGASGGGPLPPRGAEALSIGLQLLNLVEEHTANEIRRLREERIGAAAEPGLWGAYFHHLTEAGISQTRIRAALERTHVEPVFTKHPTEAKRWPVLALHRELYQLLDRRAAARTGYERREIEAATRALLHRLWLTGEIFQHKPSVEDELDNVLYYLTKVFPQVINRVDHRLDFHWEAVFGDAAPAERPSLSFGLWVGGDRDGHPFVTPDVTRTTLVRLRAASIRVIDAELAELERSLCFSRETAGAPEALLHQLDEASRREPWQAWVARLRARLPAKDLAEAVPDAFSSPDELAGELERLGGWLGEINADYLAEQYIRPLIRVIRTFGFHLADLDVRQNSAFYDRAFAQMLAVGGVEEGEAFPDWPEERRRTFLERELAHSRPLTHASMPLGEEAARTRETLQVLAEAFEAHDGQGLGCLVVSMTRQVSDLLTVYALAREVGLTRQTPEGLICRLPVVPLFETEDDLARSATITGQFLAHPITRRSLEFLRRREGRDRPRLTVMLGYSDSNKDAGILCSHWALQRAQKALLETGERHGIDIRFFHGRGGTIGRGAGPTHRFLEALPHGSLHAGLRLTEQGEVIGQKFNNPETAITNLELLLAGTVGASLLGEKRQRTEATERAMDFLAAQSRQAYRDLLEQPGFIHFYREATPIDAIERSRIGSRPARRTGNASLDDLRAIPWVFSWNQARFYLPGWFGAGSALRSLRTGRPEDHATLREESRRDPFLRYLFYNVEASLASASEYWMTAYADLVDDGELRQHFLEAIVEEFRLVTQEMNHLYGEPLEKRRPRFVQTLAMRKEALDLLHGEQIRQLRLWRGLDPDDPEGERALDGVLLTVNAIASGLRTTG